LQTQWIQLEAGLQVAKAERDHWEKQVETFRRQVQQLQWQVEQLGEKLQAQSQQKSELEIQVAEQALICQTLNNINLPIALVQLPVPKALEMLSLQRQKIQRRMSSLEPVNMLAIEEYNQIETRLTELNTKLHTLTHERTELLLRIENLDTLKQTAFLGAFEAVNNHFQSIFTDLSDGDGHLELENPEHPFSGGLTLVAHPKGKKIRRLESMSGGEKSLTALSFIFALQRYRPSPFYAFDEVDMFLDGANVERLAHMIQKSAQSAQFVVVSLRRPMIDRADQTIGVTLGREQQSQVLGLKPTANLREARLSSQG